MTQDQRRRVVEAIAESARMLEKTMTKKAFDADQERDLQEQVDFYQAHILKLNGMLGA